VEVSYIQGLFDGILRASERDPDAIVARCDYGAGLRGLIRAGSDPGDTRAGPPRDGMESWEIHNAFLLVQRYTRLFCSGG